MLLGNFHLMDKNEVRILIIHSLLLWGWSKFLWNKGFQNDLWEVSTVRDDLWEGGVLEVEE
jgi:hypothetical protein